MSEHRYRGICIHKIARKRCTPMQLCTHENTPAQTTHTHARMHARTHAHPHSRDHHCTHTHTHTHTHTPHHTHTCTCLYIMHTNKHEKTSIHAHAHAHARAHANTHTHTYTLIDKDMGKLIYPHTDRYSHIYQNIMHYLHAGTIDAHMHRYA